MLKKILIGAGVLLAVFLLVVAVQPSNFRVQRSATISAPPAEVFPHINDFHNWDAWSPWAKLDPAVTNTFEGPPSGTGAIFMWSGNKEVGAGRMTIIESRPPEFIRIKLDFIRPFESTSTTEFTLRPEGAGTILTWAMFGQNNFIAKAFCLFMNMDKMVGGDFERGLTSLKTTAEAKQPSAAPAPTTPVQSNPPKG